MEHLHDLGKWMFALTVFWTYIAFSQYMLIWYANLPEETIFFYNRMQGSWLYISLLLVFGHFIFPFFLLLARGAKRSVPDPDAGCDLAAVHLLRGCVLDGDAGAPPAGPCPPLARSDDAAGGWGHVRVRLLAASPQDSHDPGRRCPLGAFAGLQEYVGCESIGRVMDSNEHIEPEVPIPDEIQAETGYDKQEPPAGLIAGLSACDLYCVDRR